MKSILRIRPFQLVILVIFILFALIGLYLFTTYKGFSGGSDIGAVTIWGTLPQQAMTQELATITSADKGFGKVTYVQKDASTFDMDLANAIASGDGPDLILINQEQLVTEESKLDLIPFSAISERTFLDSYLPEYSLYLTSTGTYGIPYVLDPLVLYYNSDMLTSADVSTPPTTWEAITGLAPSLSRVQNSAISQSAIPLGTYDNVEDARGILSLLLLQAGNSITQTSPTGLLVSDLDQTSDTLNGESLAQSAVSFYTQFADPTRVVYSWNESQMSAQQAFTTEKAALYIGYASEEPFIAAANPNLAFDMSAIPQLQTATVKTDYGLAYAFAIPKASGNAKGAYAVAEELSASAYLPSAAQALTMVPSVRTLLAPSNSDPYQQVYYPEALIARGWLSPAPATTDQIFSRMVTSITSGAQNAADAVAAASQSLSAALASP